MIDTLIQVLTAQAPVVLVLVLVTVAAFVRPLFNPRSCKHSLVVDVKVVLIVVGAPVTVAVAVLVLVSVLVMVATVRIRPKQPITPETLTCLVNGVGVSALGGGGPLSRRDSLGLGRVGVGSDSRRRA